MSKWGNIVKGWKLIIFSVILSAFFFSNTEVFAQDVLEEVVQEEIILEEIIELEEKKELGNASEICEEEIIKSSEELEIKEEDTLVQDKVIVEFDKEVVFTKYSNNMEFQDDIAIVRKDLEEELTVLSVLENIDIVELKNTYGVETIVITNQDDIWLGDTDKVINGYHIVFIGSSFISCYEINILGDINQDSNITEEDVKIGVDEYLNNTVEENKESILTEEISYIDTVVENNTYEVEIPVEEELTSNLINIGSNELYKEEKVVVQYKIDGMSINYFNTISGMIHYNQEVLLLEDIYVLVDGKVIGGYLDNQFIYVVDNYQSNNYFLVMVFKSVGIGVTNVSLEYVKVAMNGYLLEVENSNDLKIVVYEPGKGGDVNNSINNSSDNDVSNFVIEPVLRDKKPTILTPSNSQEKSSQVVTTVVLSSDNYIKNLEIKGYSIEFDKEIGRYFIDVDNDVSNLNLNVLLNDSNSSYFITGNEEFKGGKNEIILTVFAEDGSTRDYVIEVNKKESDIQEEVSKDDNERELKRIALLIILGILIVTIIWIMYRIFKEED